MVQYRAGRTPPRCPHASSRPAVGGRLLARGTLLRYRHELRPPLLTGLFTFHLAETDVPYTVAFLGLPKCYDAGIRGALEARRLSRAGGLGLNCGRRWACGRHLSRCRRCWTAGESAVLDGQLGDLRSGRGRALVVRGEAGVGKSALLDYLAGAAADMRVARAAGAESEMELALAGLHPLCAPLRDWLERLPVPQRGGLKTAFGLPHRSRAGPIPGRAGGADVAVRGDGRPATAVRGRCRAVAGPGISAGAGVRGAAAAGRAGGTGLPSRGADALHLLWSACLGRVGPGVTGRVHLPARRFPQPTSTGLATRRGQVPQRPAARPGADGCASAPGGSLGILTEAILASERDSGAIGRQNAITASNSASHPWRIR